MKQRILSLLVLLAAAVTGAWAESKPIGLNVEYAVGDEITSTTDVYVYFGEEPGSSKQMVVKITSTQPLKISKIDAYSIDLNGDAALYYMPDGDATGGSAGFIFCVGESTGDETVVHVASGSGTLTEPYVFAPGSAAPAFDYELTAEASDHGSGTISYTVQDKDDAEKITENAKGANEGDKVTVAIAPDEGWRVDPFAVTAEVYRYWEGSRRAQATVPMQRTVDLDYKGNDENGVATYSFTMPASNVKVKGAYNKVSTLYFDPADRTNLMEVKKAGLPVNLDKNDKTVKIDKVEDILEGAVITLTANTGYKFRKVEVKKAAVAEGHALTSAKLDEIVCSDGKAYAAADKDILPKGVKAEALVCYANGEHGLALAMADVKNDKMSWDNDRGANDGKTAAEWCDGWNTSHPITGATWLLASKTQWDNMINAAGGASNLSKAFSAVGGTNLQAFSYWSSTPNIGVSAWRYHFPSSSWSWTYLNQDNTGSYIRACLQW